MIPRRPGNHPYGYQRLNRPTMNIRTAYPKGTVIRSRDGELKGKTTGSFKQCRLEGCGGVLIGVRWPHDGKLTWPCSKSMKHKRLG